MGGGVYISGKSKIDKSSFIGNGERGNQGAAIFIYGRNDNILNVHITNSIFLSNMCNYANCGTIQSWGGSFEIKNNIIKDNNSSGITVSSGFGKNKNYHWQQISKTFIAERNCLIVWVVFENQFESAVSVAQLCTTIFFMASWNSLF